MARTAAKSDPEITGGRKALLAAARELLSEHGGSRFSLAEVAARSGKNSALVKYYFGGKQQMLVAILATVIAAFYPTWRAAQVQPAWQLKSN